jgi:ribulose bisphosphate carboxylase small subunit
MGAANYLQAIRPDTAKLRKMIENGLLFDWIIRIEHSDLSPDGQDWRQWENAQFAVRSAEPVLAALKRCYEKHPDCVIRINAEKVRPQTSMLYTAYNPRYVTADNIDVNNSAKLQKVETGRIAPASLISRVD